MFVFVAASLRVPWSQTVDPPVHGAVFLPVTVVFGGHGLSPHGQPPVSTARPS